jgi:NAD(P)H-nitrite reductase large subunit
MELEVTELAPYEVQTGPCGGECRTCPSIGSCPDRVVCRCLRVTEETIISAVVTLGLRTVKELRTATEAGEGCGCCHRELHGYLAVYASSSSPLICSAK